jgi:hypothetical protein
VNGNCAAQAQSHNRGRRCTDVARPAQLPSTTYENWLAQALTATLA